MNAGERHKTSTLWLCGLLHALTHFYMVALLPLYLLIQEDFGLRSAAGSTLLMTVMMTGYFGPSTLAGFLADKVSRKRLLVAGLVINAAAFIGLAGAPSYPVALVCVAIAGVGGSLYHPAAVPWVASLYPVNTGRALGLVGIGASVGFFCAPLYVGWRAAHEGWRAPILEIGAAGLVVAAVFGLLAEKDQLPRPRADAPQPTSTGATPLPWACLAAASLLLSLRDFAGSATSSLASLFLQKAHQFNPSATGLALSAIFLPGIISNPLFGHLSDRSRTRSLALVLVVSAAAMMLLPYAPKSWVVPLLLVYGFFFMSSFPMVEAAVVMSAPEQVRGRVFGVFLTVGGLIGSLGHWFSGVWVRNLGERADQAQSYVGVFGVLAMLVIGALGALPFVRAMRRQAAPPTALAENGLESNQPEVAP